MTVSAEAVTVAAEALHDLECCTPGCGPAEKDFRRARHMLEASAPLIAAAECQRILRTADLQLVLGFARGTGGKPKAVREALDGIARLERELGTKP